MINPDEALWFAEELEEQEESAFISKGLSGDGPSPVGEPSREKIRLLVDPPRWSWLSVDRFFDVTGAGARRLLVRLGFQFVVSAELSERGFGVAWARCLARLAGAAAKDLVVLDVFPRSLHQGLPLGSGVAVGPDSSFRMVGAEQSLSELGSGPLEPVVVGYLGEDQVEPYWELTPVSGGLVGMRTFWLLLSVAAGCREIRLSAMAEAMVRNRLRYKHFFGATQKTQSPRPVFTIPVPPESGSEPAPRCKEAWRPVAQPAGGAPSAPAPAMGTDLRNPAGTKILFVSASPTDAGRIRVEREAREIQERLNRSEIKTEIRLAARLRDLYEALNANRPTIVHFCGHGDPRGIVLENESGTIDIVSAQALAAVFATFVDIVEVVVLNSCYSAAQVELLAQKVSYVIGYEGKVNDANAIPWASQFYSALSYGRSVEAAHQQACDFLESSSGGVAPLPILRRGQ